MEEAVGGGFYGESVFAALAWLSRWLDKICFIKLCRAVGSCTIAFASVDLAGLCDGASARHIAMLFPNTRLIGTSFSECNAHAIMRRPFAAVHVFWAAGRA